MKKQYGLSSINTKQRRHFLLLMRCLLLVKNLLVVRISYSLFLKIYSLLLTRYSLDTYSLSFVTCSLFFVIYVLFVVTYSLTFEAYSLVTLHLFFTHFKILTCPICAQMFVYLTSHRKLRLTLNRLHQT